MSKSGKIQKRMKRKRSIRKKISGTASIPRMTVFRSSRHIYAQIIDDVTGITLVSASTMAKDFKPSEDGDKKARAKMIGEMVALKCKEKGIEKVVFDRNGFLFHGRIKILADAARAKGLTF